MIDVNNGGHSILSFTAHDGEVSVNQHVLHDCTDPYCSRLIHTPVYCNIFMFLFLPVNVRGQLADHFDICMYGAPCMHVVRSHVLRGMFWHIPSAAISDTHSGRAYTLAPVNE
jgi:hypothetical protein